MGFGTVAESRSFENDAELKAKIPGRVTSLESRIEELNKHVKVLDTDVKDHKSWTESNVATLTSNLKSLKDWTEKSDKSFEKLLDRTEKLDKSQEKLLEEYALLKATVALTIKGLPELVIAELTKTKVKWYQGLLTSIFRYVSFSGTLYLSLAIN